MIETNSDLKGEKMKKLFYVFIFTIVFILSPVFSSELETGYNGGIYLKTKDGKFSLKIKNRIQFQGYYIDYEAPEPSEKSFRIRRARLYFEGNGFFPWLKYKIQLTMEGAQVATRDFYLDFAYRKEIYPRFGQYKVPFSREYLTSSSSLQLVDRSIVNSEFSAGRDMGFSLYGNIDKRFEYGIGIFNGSGKNSKNLDDDFLFVGRALWTPTGEFKYAHSALEFPEKPVFAVGAAFTYFPGYEPLKEKSSDRKHLASVVKNISVGENDVSQLTADFAFKYQGLSFEGDFHYRSINPEETGVNSVKSRGFRLQAGYLFNRKYELAVRYSSLDPNTDVSKDLKQETTAGFNYFISKHRLKFQVDYSYLTTETTVKTEKDHRLRAQFQFYF